MTKLHEIMSYVVATADDADTVDRVRKKMRLFRAHQLVVMHGQDVVGVVSKRDLPSRAGARRDDVSLRALTKPIVTAAATVTVGEAEALVNGRDVGGVAVTLHGSIVGFVPLGVLHDARDREDRAH